MELHGCAFFCVRGNMKSCTGSTKDCLGAAADGPDDESLWLLDAELSIDAYPLGKGLAVVSLARASTHLSSESGSSDIIVGARRTRTPVLEGGGSCS